MIVVGIDQSNGDASVFHATDGTRVSLPTSLSGFSSDSSHGFDDGGYDG